MIFFSCCSRFERAARVRLAGEGRGCATRDATRRSVDDARRASQRVRVEWVNFVSLRSVATRRVRPSRRPSHVVPLGSSSDRSVYRASGRNRMTHVSICRITIRRFGWDTVRWMDGWMYGYPTHLSLGSDDRRPACARIHPSIEPMQPISLRGYQTLVRRSGGRETRVERVGGVGGVCAVGMDRTSRWVARVYGALWILVLDFSQTRESAESFVFI